MLACVTYYLRAVSIRQTLSWEGCDDTGYIFGSDSAHTAEFIRAFRTNLYPFSSLHAMSEWKDKEKMIDIES